MNEFFVGQKVVCIADHFEGMFGEDFPRFNCIYTVRVLDFERVGLCLRLKEVINTPQQYDDSFGEATFLASRFRPLESKAISVFRKIARDVTEGKKVEIEA